MTAQSPDPGLVERYARWFAREEANQGGIWFDDKQLNLHIEARWHLHIERAQRLLAALAPPQADHAPTNMLAERLQRWASQVQESNCAMAYDLREAAAALAAHPSLRETSDLDATFRLLDAEEQHP